MKQKFACLSLNHYQHVNIKLWYWQNRDGGFAGASHSVEHFLCPTRRWASYTLIARLGG